MRSRRSHRSCRRRRHRGTSLADGLVDRARHHLVHVDHQRVDRAHSRRARAASVMSVVARPLPGVPVEDRAQVGQLARVDLAEHLACGLRQPPPDDCSVTPGTPVATRCG